MARRRRPKQAPNSAAHTLDVLESRGDRIAAWIGENPVPIVSVGVAVLLIAAIWGFLSQDNNEEDLLASAELSSVQASYRVAMGAQSGAIDVPEPANPEAARSIRADFVDRYEQVAAQSAGTVAGTVAFLEAGKLAQQLGDLDAAEEQYSAGLEQVPSGDVLAAFFLIRLGSIEELRTSWADAAAFYARAAELPEYPLRPSAVADAIRCYLEAGDSSSALAMARTLESDSDSAPLPYYVSAQLAELAGSTGAEPLTP